MVLASGAVAEGKAVASMEGDLAVVVVLSAPAAPTRPPAFALALALAPALPLLPLLRPRLPERLFAQEKDRCHHHS